MAAGKLCLAKAKAKASPVVGHIPSDMLCPPAVMYTWLPESCRHVQAFTHTHTCPGQAWAIAGRFNMNKEAMQ